MADAARKQNGLHEEQPIETPQGTMGAAILQELVALRAEVKGLRRMMAERRYTEKEVQDIVWHLAHYWASVYHKEKTEEGKE